MLLHSTQDMKNLRGWFLQEGGVVCLSSRGFFKLENLLEAKKTLGAFGCSTDPKNCMPEATFILQLPPAKGNRMMFMFFLPFDLKQLHDVPNAEFRHHLGSDLPLALSHSVRWSLRTLQESDEKPTRNACDILSGAQSALKQTKGWVEANWQLPKAVWIT